MSIVMLVVVDTEWNGLIRVFLQTLITLSYCGVIC